MTDQPNPVQAMIERAASGKISPDDTRAVAAAARDAAEALQILACTPPVPVDPEPVYVNDSYSLNGHELTLWDGTVYVNRDGARAELTEVVDACDALVDEYREKISDAEHAAWNAGYSARCEDEYNPRTASDNPHPAPAPKVPQL